MPTKFLKPHILEFTTCTKQAIISENILKTIIISKNNRDSFSIIYHNHKKAVTLYLYL